MSTDAAEPGEPKNIVICLDGTGNAYGSANTNIVKLFQMLEPDSDMQIAAYDPGVGTFSAHGAWTRTSKAWTKLLGLAVGFGLAQTVENAYRFLMRNYHDGDRIFIFGFSRGSYAARVLAGFLHKCGLLCAQLDELVPYAYDIFRKETDWTIVSGFTGTFARPVKVHFLGLWDTVNSVGWVWNPTILPFTAHNPGVDVVRHAVSIDERRAFFRSNLWGKVDPGQDVQELWFAGVHSDVGGSYPEAEAGLAQITLDWMSEQAMQCGLRVDPAKRLALVPKPSRPPGSIPASPVATAMQHESLHAWWWIAELFPKWVHVKNAAGEYHVRPRINLGRYRDIPNGGRMHPSVLQRWTDPSLKYCPSNLRSHMPPKTC